MEFPVEMIINYDEKKYEMAAAMIKYSLKIEDVPEILLEFDEKDRDKRLRIVFNGLLSGKVKYLYKTE